MRFEFATVTRIIFGAGTIKESGALAKEFGRRALIATGRDTSRENQLTDLLRKEGVASVLFAVQGEPEIETITNGNALAKKERCDMVISIGGGSVIDAGKAIAAVLSNEGELLDYLEVIGKGT